MADAAHRSFGQMVDQYAVLGLEPGADQTAVRAAYRRLARQFHPDVNRSAAAPEQMRALNAAYAALSQAPDAPASLAGPISVAGAGAAVTPGPQPRRSGERAAPIHGAFFWERSAPVGAPTTTIGGVVPRGGLHLSPAMTVATVAGFLALVAALGVWAVAVARPFETSGGTRSAPVVAPSSRTIPSSTGSIAAQASANAAANAAAARSNALNLGSTRRETLPQVPPAASAGAVQPNATAVVSAQLSHQVAPAEAPAPGGRTEHSGAPALTAQPTSPALAEHPVQETAPRSNPATQVAQVAQAVQAAPVTQSGSPAVVPVIPAVPAARTNTAPRIESLSSQPTGETAALVGTARRALAAYDRAWTNYAAALRSATAGSMAVAAGTSRGSAAFSGGAAALLSGDGQVTVARSLYFQQQVAWNQRAGGVLAAAVSEAPDASRPDGAKAARAELRLRQAAELVVQAQSSGTPAPAAQVKALLGEAEAAHREWVAEWATLLASLT